MLSHIKVCGFSVILILLTSLSLMGDDLLSQDRRALADGLMARGLYRLALPEYEALAKETKVELDVVLYRLAECKRQLGDIDGAIKLCDRISTEFPSSPTKLRSQITFALSLDSNGNHGRAAEIFDKIASSPDSDVELRLKASYFSGESRFRNDDYAGAKSRFSMVIKMAEKQESEPSFMELVGFSELYIAEIDAKAGTPEGIACALSRYEAVAKRKITHRISAEALFKGGVLAYSNKKYDEAVSRFLALSTLYPNDKRVNDALVPTLWANFNAGRYSEALGLVEKTKNGVDNDVARAECLYVKAASLAALVRRGEAVASYDELISTYPQSKLTKTAKYERLVNLYRDARYEEVLKDATMFTDAPDSVMPDLIWLQAESAEALKDRARAQQFYNMVFVRYGKSRLAPEALYRHSTYLRDSGSYPEAVKGYQQLIANYPDSELLPYSLFASACGSAHMRKDEDAVRDFKTLLANHPSHKLIPEATLQMALSLHRLGLVNDAAMALDGVITKFPTYQRLENVKFERARFSYELKDYGQTERLLREVLAKTDTIELKRESNFLLGLALEAQGKAQEAAALFQPLLEPPFVEKVPDERLVWLSEFQFSQKKYKEAKEAAGFLLKRSLSKELEQKVNVIIGRAELALSNTNGAINAFVAAADAPLRTSFSAEAALKAGELLLDNYSQLERAANYLKKAVEIASTPELGAIRARAYYGLALSYERLDKVDEAVRLYLAMSLLYDDKELIIKSMTSAARLLDARGRTDEAAVVRQDLYTLYPEVKTNE